VVIMSAGAPQNAEQLYPRFFANSAAGAKQMRMIWLAAGDEDFALNGTKAIDELLTKNDITHSFKITTGRHEWRLWRPHLNEFAQLLFKDTKTGGTR
jgi:enterochelin esterase-like enzyme